MTTLKEIITAYEYRMNVAKAKVKIGFEADKFQIIADTYEEALRDLRRLKHE